MKNKNFTKFAKRNTHKRAAKDAARAELLRAVRECGVAADGVKIKDSSDSGRRGRVTDRAGRDECVASGAFSGSRAGFGFVNIGDEDIFIPEGKCGGAIDGDIVEIVYHRYENRFGEEKTEGRVRKIIEYGRKYMVGEVDEFYRRHGRRTYRGLVFFADGGRLYPAPEIIGGEACEPGDKVQVKLIRGDYDVACEVVKNFGKAYTREANYEAILAEFDIPLTFTPEELSEAERAAAEPISNSGRVRRDSEIIFTMDGEGAKDLDDAVSLVRCDGGYRLGVHIADVSHYVKEKTALDRCAMARGTSTYFTDKVVPMLPPALSNGACSLNSGEEKYALSAIIDIDAAGEIISLSLEKSIIKTAVRGVYSEINRILCGEGTPELTKKYEVVMPSLLLMKELYFILKERHERRGAIDFEGAEAEIVLDERGDPCKIIPRERGISERIIEQFMLMANEAVASELHRRGVPCVYRIHEAPPEDKLDGFVSFAHNLGFDTSYIRRESVDNHALRRLLLAAEERGLLEPVSYSMLRAMSKAKYSEILCGHFGLGIEKYCHFTSPIRRLSDLATHRIIKRVLFDGKNAANYASYAKRAAAAATEGELRAIGAERKIEDLYKCVYMSKFIGEKFEGRISSVTSFGLFVMLENTCEGLIPLREMPFECRYDEKNVSVYGRNFVFRLGDKIRVKVEECDTSEGKVRFSLAR